MIRMPMEALRCDANGVAATRAADTRRATRGPPIPVTHPKRRCAPSETDQRCSLSFAYSDTRGNLGDLR
jgi:hypothetical protein